MVIAYCEQKPINLEKMTCSMISNATIELYKYQPIRYAFYIPALEDSTNQICFLYSNSNQTKGERSHHASSNGKTQSFNLYS